MSRVQPWGSWLCTASGGSHHTAPLASHLTVPHPSVPHTSLSCFSLCVLQEDGHGCREKATKSRTDSRERSARSLSRPGGLWGFSEGLGSTVWSEGCVDNTRGSTQLGLGHTGQACAREDIGLGGKHFYLWSHFASCSPRSKMSLRSGQLSCRHCRKLDPHREADAPA